ncbi:MAG: hypothetical protein GX053_06195 [Tissierella sp.]|nr:hypothetical protein [Tissierella sp.]
MTEILELLEIILEVILTWLSPEGVAKKVNDENSTKLKRFIHIMLFSLVYASVLIGLAIYFTIVSDIFIKVFIVLVSIFLLYCMFKFYYKIINP